MKFSPAERRLLDDIWSTDFAHAKKGVWWWWFWIYFLDNPKNPDKPLQLMVLWSTKKEPTLEVNDVTMDLSRGHKHVSAGELASGAIAAWYFDGEQLHENFLLEQGPLLIERQGQQVQSLTKQKGVFRRVGDDLEVVLSKPGMSMKFSSPLSDGPGRVLLRNQRFVKKFTYRIVKLNRLPVRAEFDVGGKKRKLTGTSYFQYVRVASPVVPWMWSIVHFKKGSVFSYMVPRVGAGFFNEDLYGAAASANLPVKSRIDFYYAPDKKWYEFFGVTVKAVKRPEGPAFVVSYTGKEASIEAEFQSYSKALWKLGKPFLKAFKSNLYYNEYAVRATKFMFRRNGKTETLQQFGAGVGNCEHSWGFLP